MFGGLLKSTSLAALVAVAGVAISGASAQAADLGGNCCADLEERIAELEATTARKGNRKVSLTVSGQINQAVMAWDDGVESNVYVTDNETARSRFRFLGSAKIDAKWSAGYLMELGVADNDQNNLSQNVTQAAEVVIRHSAWFLQHKDLGKVWVGQTSMSTDGITEVNLANTGHFFGPATASHNSTSFKYRLAGGAQSVSTIGSVFTAGGDGFNPGEGSRNNLVKYESPVIAGFIASAAFGEDDLFDVALRYAGEFSGFKLAAGIGYIKNSDTNNKRGCAASSVGGSGNDVDCNELGLSASVMHVGTGLFVTGAYGQREDNKRAATLDKTDDFYMVMGGIEQAFFPLGKSTLFGSYQVGSVNSGLAPNAASAGPPAVVAGATAGIGLATITSAEYTNWGVGFNQNIAAAAMDLYVNYNNYSYDLKAGAVDVPVNDFQTLVAGARIQF